MATITIGITSYVTEAELDTYAADRGITISATDKTVLLVKAMDFLEVQPFKGVKTVSTQSLQFPRVICDQFGDYRPNSYGYNGYEDYYCEYPSDEVPQRIKDAQIIAALLIDSGEDLQPNVGRSVKREKVDVLEVEYMDTSSDSTRYTQLQDILKPFIKSGFTARRG